MEISIQGVQSTLCCCKDYGPSTDSLTEPPPPLNSTPVKTRRLQHHLTITICSRKCMFASLGKWNVNCIDFWLFALYTPPFSRSIFLFISWQPSISMRMLHETRPPRPQIPSTGSITPMPWRGRQEWSPYKMRQHLVSISYFNYIEKVIKISLVIWIKTVKTVYLHKKFTLWIV